MQVKAILAMFMFTLLPSASHATNLMYMPFESVLSKAMLAGRLDGSVKFYLAGNGPTANQQLLRPNVISDLGTNASNKSDHDACEWVLQSNLIKLQADAKRAGANAVTNIVSYYDQHVRKDLNTYECRVGVFVARVALRGDLVRLPLSD
ncbi:excinuclease [Pseudomonas prosekii]|uniref:Excinuclease n=1 Tax=Pseudomonas prosekii TaxID=1148509 RepID=A0A2U2DEX6_9PSED|nr:excinuclease [Pseudomonas prosekii]PWE47948.1 excinuclease [Pseudomonas prosekii]